MQQPSPHELELRKTADVFEKTTTELKNILFHSAKSATTTSLIKQARKEVLEESNVTGFLENSEVTLELSKRTNNVIMNTPKKESAADVLNGLFEDMFPEDDKENNEK